MAEDGEASIIPTWEGELEDGLPHGKVSALVLGRTCLCYLGKVCNHALNDPCLLLLRVS